MDLVQKLRPRLRRSLQPVSRPHFVVEEIQRDTEFSQQRYAYRSVEQAVGLVDTGRREVKRRVLCQRNPAEGFGLRRCAEHVNAAVGVWEVILRSGAVRQIELEPPVSTAKRPCMPPGKMRSTHGRLLQSTIETVTGAVDAGCDRADKGVRAKKAAATGAIKRRDIA